MAFNNSSCLSLAAVFPENWHKVAEMESSKGADAIVLLLFFKVVRLNSRHGPQSRVLQFGCNAARLGAINTSENRKKCRYFTGL